MIGNYLHKLHTLKLNFSHCEKLQNQSLNHVVSRLQNKSEELRHLELDFSGADIDNDGIKSLSMNLLPNCKKLKTLRLHFYGCVKIDDKGVTSLSETITNHLANVSNIGLHSATVKKSQIKALKNLQIVLERINKAYNISILILSAVNKSQILDSMIWRLTLQKSSLISIT